MIHTPIPARNKQAKKLLPDGRHQVQVHSVSEGETISIIFTNQLGYTTLWLDIDEHACNVLYGILHCAGRKLKKYDSANEIKKDLIGCKLYIDILNNQVQTILKHQNTQLSY